MLQNGRVDQNALKLRFFAVSVPIATQISIATVGDELTIELGHPLGTLANSEPTSGRIPIYGSKEAEE